MIKLVKMKIKIFIENVVMITEEGFNIISHSQGPLKDKGFAC